MADAKRQKAKGGRKHRKHGRNKVSCDIYAREARSTKNKIRHLRKRVASHPNDKIAQAALARLG